MRIAIIGASAGVGLQCVRQALTRGHQVTALARHCDALPSQDSRIRVLAGDATHLADLHAAIDDADAVVVTLGMGRSVRATTLFSDAARVLLQVLDAKTLPLVVLTGFGVADSLHYQPWFVRPLFRLVLGRVYDDKAEMERIITGGYRDWVMVRPGILTHGPARGLYHVFPTLERGMKVGRISRADVAHFMFAQAESPTCLRQYPVLTD